MSFLPLFSGSNWVANRYASAGTLPDIAADFVNNRYWDSRNGNISLTDMWSLTRTTTEAAVGSSGTWSQFGSGVLARTDLGLNAWEARTNSIRNNSMQGAAAGTLPTNWVANTSISGLTRTIVGVGIENGVDYLDIQYTGTANAGTAGTISVETNINIVASNGQTWAQSAFIKLAAGSLNGVTFSNRISMRDGAGAALAGLDTAIVPTATLTRVNNIQTLNNASTAFVQPQLFFTPVNGQVIDFTLRIGWPQLELGASVTPPIRTTSAAATRNADATSLRTALTLGSAYTIYAAGIPQSPVTFSPTQQLLDLTDGTTSNSWLLRRDTGTGTLQARGTSSGTGFGPGASAVVNPSVAFKMAAAYAASDQASSLNGAAAQTSSSALSPVTLTQLNLGCTPSPSQYWNGQITEVAIWPTTRITNAQLQAITA